MDWTKLISLPKWTPVAQLPCSFVELGHRLYKIEDTQYCLVTPYNSPNLEVVVGGPFLSALLWAPSDSAAKRAVLEDKEGDDMAIQDVPPEILPVEDALTYHKILLGLRTKNYDALESASYRMRDGQFVHRVIASRLADYYFRGREDNGDELPYAILWRFGKWLRGSWLRETHLK